MSKSTLPCFLLLVADTDVAVLVLDGLKS